MLPCESIYMVYTSRMETTIQKWGNSLGVRLPKSISDKKSLIQGSRVVVSETETGVLIEAVVKPHTTLDALLAGITKDTLHEGLDWGPPVGKEIW